MRSKYICLLLLLSQSFGKTGTTNDFVQPDDSCILVVGTTGTGKTSTVNIYTGSELQVGEGAQSVTGATIAVDDDIHPNAPKWIDNPGTDNI